MNQRIARLTLHTPQRRLLLALTLSCLLGSGVRPYPPQIIPTAAGGTLVACQDDSPCSPEDIEQFLKDNSEVQSAAEFLESLPIEYKQHWVMMTRSQSLQTGTATSPRFLLPSRDASKVFAFELEKMPQQGSEIIEYLHFVESTNGKPTNRFRFHLINMGTRTVQKDVGLCQSCHFGRPNWDAYDSWGGMLPFNRDRIYEDSEEEKAVRRLLKDLRHLQKDSIVMQLVLPRGIDENGTTGEITITHDSTDLGPDTVTCDSDGDGNNDPNTVKAFFMRDAPVSYPGEESVCVKQGGRYLLLHHSKEDLDEGRGVELFDNFTRYNARRVAQELLDHPKEPVDIRPIALAIASPLDCVNASNLTDFAPQAALDEFADHHGMSFDELIEDTRERRGMLPKLKADLQADNLGGPAPYGLIRENDPQKRDPSSETITQQVFRRSKQGFELDKVTRCLVDGETDGCMIDRERKPDPMFFEAQSTTIALFRFFLEPPKKQVDESRVRVDTWSLSVRDRSQTYTFGDLFSQYTDQITSELTKALTKEGQLEEPVACPDLAAASTKAFEAAFPPPPRDPNLPPFRR